MFFCVGGTNEIITPCHSCFPLGKASEIKSAGCESNTLALKWLFNDQKSTTKHILIRNFGFQIFYNSSCSYESTFRSERDSLSIL